MRAGLPPPPLLLLLLLAAVGGTGGGRPAAQAPGPAPGGPEAATNSAEGEVFMAWRHAVSGAPGRGPLPPRAPGGQRLRSVPSPFRPSLFRTHKARPWLAGGPARCGCAPDPLQPADLPPSAATPQFHHGRGRGGRHTWEGRVYSEDHRRGALVRDAKKGKGNHRQRAKATAPAGPSPEPPPPPPPPKADQALSYTANQELELEVAAGPPHDYADQQELPPCPEPAPISDAEDVCMLARGGGGGGARRRRRTAATCLSKAWAYRTNRGGHKYAHMATLAALADGTLVVGFQAAPRHEGEAEQTLYVTRSHDGGRAWEEARTAFHVRPMPRPSYRPLWGPALSRPKGDRKLSLFFSKSCRCRAEGSRTTWRPGGDVLVASSVDGLRWSEPKTLSQEASGQPPVPKVTANPPVVLRLPRGSSSKVEYLLPFWAEVPKRSNCNYTDPETGRTTAVTTAAVLSKKMSLLNGADLWANGWAFKGRMRGRKTYLIEGAIVNLRESVLVQFFRTLAGRVFMARSEDAGETWTVPAPTALPNPNSKVHAITLSNGAIAMAYNAHNKTINGIASWGIRTLLTVATSDNEGKSFEVLAQVETQVQHGLQFHYPTLLQRGCDLFMAYSVAFSGVVEEDSDRLQTGIRVARMRLRLSG